MSTSHQDQPSGKVGPRAGNGRAVMGRSVASGLKRPVLLRRDPSKSKEARL